MSLITRCPACGTMFKVVPDQLRISEGWVRCGHCAEVFDASAHMRGDEPAAPADPVDTAQETPAPVVAPVPVADPVAREEPEREPQREPEPESPPLAEPEAELEPAAYPDPTAQVLADLPLEPADPAPVIHDFAAVGELSAHEDAAADEPASLEDVSFVRQARRKAFWRRPLVRVSLVLLAGVLVTALALQVAVQERDRLAAAQPALKPWLQQLCEPLRCQVGPPRQIESVVIDGSSFSKLRGDAYRLNFTLRNQAPSDIAMPAVELTLTDGQDQPVVRRVLTPADLGVVSGTLAGGADWSGNFALSVSGNGLARVAGYRVLAFYP